MTKASPARKAKKGKVADDRRNLLPQEVMELQEINRSVNAKKFEAAQIKGNTALIPRGQEVAAEIEAVARLLENVRDQWVTAKLVECGYPAGSLCTFNMSTGEIALQSDQ